MHRIFHNLMSLLAFIAICCFSCKNACNELLPNNAQDIVLFTFLSENYQIRSVSTSINDEYITVKVPKRTDVTKLFVQANLFPLTLRYWQEAFPTTDIVALALRMNGNSAEKNLESWFLDIYLENPNFKIPPLVFPINFWLPVQFAVMGGQGGLEIYTVNVLYDDGSDPSSLPAPVPDEIETQESEKKILTFKTPHQTGESIITEGEVNFFCLVGTDVLLLLPEVGVSENCIAVSLTSDYVFAIANKLNRDALSIVQGFFKAPDKEEFLRVTLASCDTTNLVLDLDKSIDFTEVVQFLVLNKKDKTSAFYTVTCLIDGANPYLESIGFSKWQNMHMMKDANGTINGTKKTIDCTVYYTVEYVSTHPEAYKLYVDLSYSGDSIESEYNGSCYAEYEAIPFQPVKITLEQYLLDNAIMKVHVLQDGKKVTYTMRISFKEDADTIRSITDFRVELLISGNNSIKNLCGYRPLINMEKWGLKILNGTSISDISSLIQPGDIFHRGLANEEYDIELDAEIQRVDRVLSIGNSKTHIKGKVSNVRDVAELQFYEKLKIDAEVQDATNLVRVGLVGNPIWFARKISNIKNLFPAVIWQILYVFRSEIDNVENLVIGGRDVYVSVGSRVYHTYDTKLTRIRNFIKMTERINSSVNIEGMYS